MRGWVAGKKGGGKAAFESALERDFLILLEFDEDVVRYEVQPVRITYTRADRRVQGVPDVLISYSDGRPHLLCDVKYRSDLFSKWLEIKPRLRAARSYAVQRGWRYKIVTEREIRTQLLLNATFLLPYRREVVIAHERNAITQYVQHVGPTQVRMLLRQWPDQALQVWSLIAQRVLKCDLNAPLSTESLVWL